MVEAGRIRAGDKGPKGEPRKLDKWRLTSKDRQRLDAAAQLWGGEPREWEGHAGEFEVYTTTTALPIMLLPGHEPTTWYELWSAGGCQRRCDGAHEIVSDSACLCGEERECKPHTRLPVLLPDLPGIGSWLVTSTGWNAAAELAGAADLLQRASAQGVLIPARLRLEQRTSISKGKTRRFAVPVIDIDVAFRALLGGETSREQAALPVGYTPVPTRAGNGASLAEGLATAETQTLTKPPRVPLPEDDVEDDEPGAPVSPLPSSEDGVGAPDTTGNTIAASTRDKPATKPQRDKLNVLVGQLRARDLITTSNLWKALASARNIDVDVLIAIYPDAYTPDGVLHWSPLRDSLTRAEAHDLIDRLEALESKIGAKA
jgi:hypothetical protein